MFLDGKADIIGVASHAQWQSLSSVQVSAWQTRHRADTDIMPCVLRIRRGEQHFAVDNLSNLTRIAAAQELNPSLTFKKKFGPNSQTLGDNSLWLASILFRIIASIVWQWEVMAINISVLKDL